MSTAHALRSTAPVHNAVQTLVTADVGVLDDEERITKNARLKISNRTRRGTIDHDSGLKPTKCQPRKETVSGGLPFRADGR